MSVTTPESSAVLTEVAAREPVLAAPAEPRIVWSSARKSLFRFVFLYIALYLLVVIRNVGAPVGAYESVWRKIVPWVARNILHLPYEITVFTGGSGDTTYDWVRVLCQLALAGLGAAVWSLFNRKRANYIRLDNWLRATTRYAVMATMIVYGAVKVIPAQFLSPSLDRLLQPFGDASPMGLLWTFIGASTPYNMFTGVAELTGGLLLVARRIASLGALITAAVMSNVFMMNMAYDVPVKLLSFHIVLLCVYIVWPDLRRLASALVLNQPTAAVELPRLFKRNWLHRSTMVLRVVATVAFLAYSLYGAHQIRQTFGDNAPRSPLRGIWAVEEFELEGTPVPPLMTDGARWKRVVFERPQSIAVYLMNDARVRLGATLKLEENTLAVTRGNDANWTGNFAIAQSQPELLELQGKLGSKPLRVKLRKTDLDKKFLLLTRGFHWISEAPFNR